MSADYWIDALEEAFGGQGLFDDLRNMTTEDQRDKIGADLQMAHECYGMAHYSPPASDRLNQIDREWKAKYQALEREFAAYRAGAEKAVGRALGQRADASISINERGEVHRWGGRVEQIL